MIRVELKLVSAVDAKRDRLLAAVVIANDGAGSKERGNYNVVATRDGSRVYKGRVTDFPRQSRSALELLRRALNQLHEEGGLP